MQDSSSKLLNDTLMSPNWNLPVNCKSELSTPKVNVESCQVDFFYEKYNQCYPMFKNPRGQCLIINIYQIGGMPPRRWSDRDAEALRQLFEQLLFKVTVYTDSTHDLTSKNFKQIIKNFSQLNEHDDAQCAVICLMSHGEEGFLTTKEGDKVLLDDIFNMFNNLNCPNLAGKPKLFFIQSCRDDPVTGPAEDLGIRLSFNASNVNEETIKRDESDGHHNSSFSHSDNNAINNFSSSNSSPIPNQEAIFNSPTNAQPNAYYHMPTYCDMLIGYPTQRGFIAYRKPEIGSWYMNAIVQVFSKHAHDTDLCAMLNMVNQMISNEVTNTGKKQMSEYTSKLTKPYFYFFPGLASDPIDAPDTDILLDYQTNKKKKLDENESYDLLTSYKKKTRQNMNNGYYLTENSILLNDQTDSHSSNQMSRACNKLIDFLAEQAHVYWKHIARELNIKECQIVDIDRNRSYSAIGDKLRAVLYLFLYQTQAKENEKNKFNLTNVNSFLMNQLIHVLNACKLNKIRDELERKFNAFLAAN